MTVINESSLESKLLAALQTINKMTPEQIDEAAKKSRVHFVDKYLEQLLARNRKLSKE